MPIYLRAYLLKAIIGSNPKTNKTVVWDASELANPHMGIFGDTGMGKTTLLRVLVESFVQTGHQKIRVHVFDGAGDMDMSGESSVVFHESADYGFNPLELNSDIEFGGVRKRIQSLLSALSKTSTKLGHRQERLITKLLEELYMERGFDVKNSETWKQDVSAGKLYPNLEDAIAFGKQKLRANYLGLGSKAANAFIEVNKLLKKMRAKTADLEKDSDENTRIEKELDHLREKAIMYFKEGLYCAHTGYELDELLDSDGKEETLRAVVDRFENLYSIGIYKSKPPPLNPSCRIWRYIFPSLLDDEKKLFVLTRLEAIFTRAIQRGPVTEVLDIIVLDEAHNYQDKDPQSIVNKMSREGRKYGIAMIFASQSPSDFADVVLASMGTKFVLGLDPNFWTMTMRKLGLSEGDKNWIIPRKRVVLQMKEAGRGTVTQQIELIKLVK